eukprot:TRINITY_DN8249_c0_g1_i1.p1 TRINITY_DN8249_c0_g1~~TRINITY_DN8249_c0_g1_i1.p1  ORF type:complete len:214 (+),score=42.20 TRINITY_DN8249_c0_g1_i1:43-684(+)
MGCTSSVGKQVPPPQADGAEKPKDPPVSPKQPPPKQPSVTEIKNNPSNPLEPASPVPVPGAVPPAALLTKDDDEQDLYVPPLTPRKLREIERWLNSLPTVIPDDDELQRTPRRRDSESEQSARRSEKGGEQDREVPAEGADNRASLTVEHLHHHIKILSAKEKTVVPPVEPKPEQHLSAAVEHTDGSALPDEGTQGIPKQGEQKEKDAVQDER